MLSIIISQYWTIGDFISSTAAHLKKMFYNNHYFSERFFKKQYTAFFLSANLFVSANAFFKVYPYIILE